MLQTFKCDVVANVTYEVEVTAASQEEAYEKLLAMQFDEFEKLSARVYSVDFEKSDIKIIENK